MKKLFSLVLSVILLLAGITTIHATAIENDIVAEKKALRASCLAQNARSLVQSMSPDDRNEKKQDIYTAFFSGEMDVDTAVEKLEKLGVYALPSSIEAYKAEKKAELTTYSSPTALEYNNVTIYYDSYDDTWELGAGVWWTNDSWLDDVPYSFLPYVGQEYEVGGLDGVGITLYGTSGSFKGCVLEDTWLYVSAGGGNLATTSHSPTGNIDSKYGVFHEFQDYAQLVSLSGASGTYIYYGKHISVFAKYNSNFESYNGRARLQYVHTWEDTSIASVGVNFEGSNNSVAAGFEIEFTTEKNKFNTLSPGETAF
jgi:hypothetical protein